MAEVLGQTPNALVKIVETSGLEKTKADFILEKFQGYFKIASEWELKAKMLVVTSDTQTTEMKMAREGRLFLKQKRVDIEKSRKELKEQSLREGKAIDGIANVLKGLIEPVEQYLEEQEKFVEIREEKIKEDRKQLRVAEIQQLGLEPLLYDLKNMPEENYHALVEGEKLFIQQRKEAELKAEQERIEREKEQERIRVENEKLKAEAIEKEKQLAKERAEVERQRKETEDKQRKEKEAFELKTKKEKQAIEKKLQAEKELREKADAKLKAEAEAKKREEQRLEKEKQDAQKAPDKQKLLKLAEEINQFVFPDVKSKEAEKVLSDTRELLNKTSLFIIKQTEKL